MTRRKTPKKRSTGPFWVLGVALLLIVGLFATRRDAQGAQHPKPRPTASAASVVPASRYDGYPRIKETYAEVAQVPEVVDGIYCYCHCEENMGHYSLLDCFSSDHAANCDVCLSEGALAYKMNKDGKTLDQIRHAVDQLYAQ
ncbi:MAG: CYCXC family (seleno)protein [Gemmatimonadota bacterium]|jgi:hypothetical protein